MLRTPPKMICFAMTLKVYMQIRCSRELNQEHGCALAVRLIDYTVERARRSSRDCAASTRADLRIMG